MMSISEREQETLDSIGDGLVRSAPKLASMLAIFSRLTADEQMPVREQPGGLPEARERAPPLRPGS
jgi:hypothetical protein